MMETESINLGFPNPDIGDKEWGALASIERVTDDRVVEKLHIQGH